MHFKKTGIVTALDFDCKVVYSDHTLSQKDAEDLSAAVAPLENVPEKFKDWHPDSNDQVLDLVHPSLYPLIYGRTKVLRKGNVGIENCVAHTGKGDTVPFPTPEETVQNEWMYEFGGSDVVWSGRFQWLPSDIAFTGTDSVKFTSYINNLHPYHTSLYCAVERVIARAIPLWNVVLESTTAKPLPRIPLEGWRYLYVQPGSTEVDDGKTDDASIASDSDGESEDYYEAADKVAVHPQPRQHRISRDGDVSTTHSLSKVVDLRKDFAARGLQVIVKLANIHLTPSKPNHSGGSWHIEGQLNEHIVASALYYYSQDNIGQSHLAFKQLMDTDLDRVEIPYERYVFEGIEEILGVKDEEAAYSNLGQVRTSEGRLLAFPNVLQHRVPGFGLQDPTRPGHRKILALFLVDPYVRVLGTANVPPQQLDWWTQHVSYVEDIPSLSALPAELKENIFGAAQEQGSGIPISMQEAKDIREELMKERSCIRETIVENEKANTLNFCDH